MLANVVPQPQQVFAVALDLRLRAIGPGGADDHAHAARNIEFRHHLFQATTVGRGGNLSRNAAAPGRIGHQNAEAPGQRQVSGQRRALCAALFLNHLDQQDLPAADDFLDLVVAHEARRAAFALLVVAFLVAATDGLRRRQRLDMVVVPVVGLGVVEVCFGDDSFALDRQRLGGGGRDQRGRIRLRPRLGIFRHGDGWNRIGLGRFDGGSGFVCDQRRIRGECPGLGLRRRNGRHDRHEISGRGCNRLWVIGCLAQRQFQIFFFVFPAGFLSLHLDQPLPVGDGNLIIIGMDFAERQEAVAIAAILYERRLKAWFDPDYLGEVNVPFELSLRRCLDVEIFKPGTVQHHNAGFFRVCGIDQHALRHLVLNSGRPP